MLTFFQFVQITRCWYFYSSTGGVFSVDKIVQFDIYGYKYVNQEGNLGLNDRNKPYFSWTKSLRRWGFVFSTLVS